ncbi:YdcF family protein [Actinoplanes subglobosus]|uniref:YdcF family protein n=1 Tax=Actinoplanes subglobosus TaxID=1547892 RepID=A0ABV8ITT6_9ACTN
MAFEVWPGSAGLVLAEVTHVLVPGRGRAESGFALNPEAIDRVDVAQRLFDEIGRQAHGRIVCAGYKSPIDRRGTPWRPDGLPGEVYCGMPEADLMRDELVRRGVPAESVQVERRSIDTVTNFLRAEGEGHFGDARPVAIVAQADHLERMINVIAPRTLRREYLGIVVPQYPPRTESPIVTLASRAILFGLPEDPETAITKATTRAEYVWRAATALGKRSYH